MIRFFKTAKRFQFWPVFWVVLALYIFFTLIGIVGLYVSPGANTAPNWEKVLSLANLISQIVSFLFYSLFFYLTLNFFYSLIAQRRSWTTFLQPVMVSFLLMAFYFAINYFFITRHSLRLSVGGKAPEQLTAGLVLFGYAMASFFSTAFSLLIAYLVFLRDDRKQRKVLEEQKMQLEVEKSQANLSFLKAQINPHFLHNTLNFLYAKSLPYSPELSEGILTLSDIMRYALGPAAKEGKVMLKDEIEHVRNVIKINQLRYSNNLNVHFAVNGLVNGALVVPFILITIVENAFKHGDLKSPENPINISLDILNGKLQFVCRNRKKGGPKEISTGIGLDNIKKQLDLTYGRNYSLNVKDEAEFYTTELIINAV